jgi:hypothetical protein
MSSLLKDCRRLEELFFFPSSELGRKRERQV